MFLPAEGNVLCCSKRSKENLLEETLLELMFFLHSKFLGIALPGSSLSFGLFRCIAKRILPKHVLVLAKVWLELLVVMYLGLFYPFFL